MEQQHYVPLVIVQLFFRQTLKPAKLSNKSHLKSYQIQ